MKSIYDIIIRPIITEKASTLSSDPTKLGSASLQYTFEVAKDANKVEIKKAVEELFEVQVARVNTINCKGKTRTRNTKHGQVIGRTSDYKKAVVFLKADSKPIAFFESLN